MPKVSVYLPDSLYREAQARELPLSTLTQRAVEQALQREDRLDWVARVRARPMRVSRPIDVGQLMDEARAEFGG
ncbi:MAG: hypothetical protein ACT4RN_15860 [Pseudonocardia sp.]